MGVYDIWGQNDEENLAHSDSYSISEELNVEAEEPKQAVQKYVLDLVAQSMREGTPLAELMPPPANGDHWHFKVIDSMDRTNVKEFAVRFRLMPAVEAAELEPRDAGEIDAGDNPPML